MPRYLEIRTDNVTLRSASGNRKAVILDGSKSNHGELVGFRSCSGVTVADITIQNIKWNGFKINSDHNVQNLTIYNCIIHNIWQRGVKSVRVPLENREEIRPKNIRVQHCLFYNDHPKQFTNDETDTPKTFNGNYIGGIDTMYAKNWLISDNVFINIQGRTREGRGCVFMWHHAEDCIIERNTIIDCDVGIALGNSSGIGPNQSSIHGTNMIVRNNFITRTPESGILADYTKNCQIINNTIFDPQNRMNRLLRIIHNNQGLLIANNLLSGPGMSIETKDAVRLEHNLIGDFLDQFVDVKNGDLHLKKTNAKIIDQGLSLPPIINDIDKQKRDQHVDIGADEWDKN
jgi:copper-binding protein NosD